MVETDFGGDFLRIESTKEGQIVIILNEGAYGELVYKGKTKKVLNIDVETKGEKKIWSPGLKAGRLCQEAWGTDSINWVGKKFTIFHIDGKMVIRPIVEEKIVG